MAGQIAINGAPAASTSNVQTMLYYNHTVYYANSSGTWYTLTPEGVSTPAIGDPRTTGGSTQGRIFNTTGGNILMTDGSILSNTTVNS